MGEDTPKSKRKRTPFEEREKQILWLPCSFSTRRGTCLCWWRPVGSNYFREDSCCTAWATTWAEVVFVCSRRWTASEWGWRSRPCSTGDDHLPAVGVYYARGGGWGMGKCGEEDLGAEKIVRFSNTAIGVLLYLYEELSSIDGWPVRQVQVTPSSNVLEYIAIFEVV